MLIWVGVYMVGGIISDLMAFDSYDKAKEYFDSVVGDALDTDFTGDYIVDLENGSLYFWNGEESSLSVEVKIELVEVE